MASRTVTRSIIKGPVGDHFIDSQNIFWRDEKVDVGRSWDLQVLRADGKNQNY